MRTILLTIGVLLGVQISIAQSHFENIYATSTTTYSGVEDGGVSSSIAYTYIAKTDLTLPHVSFEGHPLKLTKGDRVIFNGSRYQPYQMENEIFEDSTTQIDYHIQKKFYARKNNGIYYVGIPFDKNWAYARKYRIKMKTYTADFKKEFDVAREYAMP